MAVVVKTLETPDEHQNRWQMDVHPPKNGIAIGYAPWPDDFWPEYQNTMYNVCESPAKSEYVLVGQMETPKKKRKV